MEVPIFFGSLSGEPLADLRARNDHVAVYQLYIRDEQAQVDSIVQDLVDVGFDALCLTVDSAVYSRRERDKGRPRSAGHRPGRSRAGPIP